MRAFYDEVERIGQKVGTVRSSNGHYTVASTTQGALENHQVNQGSVSNNQIS